MKDTLLSHQGMDVFPGREMHNLRRGESKKRINQQFVRGAKLCTMSLLHWNVWDEKESKKAIFSPT